MHLEFFCASDVGRARDNNEDAVAVDHRNAIAVLADGMGGYNAGEVASRMAISIIGAELAERLGAPSSAVAPDAIAEAVAEAVQKANLAIYDAALADPRCAGMGTTLVVAAFRDARLVLGHVGDSRAYRWRDGDLEQLTHDHSLLQEQLDAGVITPADAAVSGQRNLVTRAVGIEATVATELHCHELAPGDVVLLCSDGLSDMVDDRTMGALAGARAPLADIARALVDEANEAGGKDNISVILVRVDRPVAGGRPWWPFKH